MGADWIARIRSDWSASLLFARNITRISRDKVHVTEDMNVSTIIKIKVFYQ